MAQRRVTLIRCFAVPPTELWDAIIDHEGMTRWSGAKVRVVSRGDGGGVGTVRRVSIAGLSFDEEVSYTDPPRRLVYRIVAGLPVRFHRGEILIEPWGATGSELTWDILVDSRIPGFARAVVAAVGAGLGSGLGKLADQLGS